VKIAKPKPNIEKAEKEFSEALSGALDTFQQRKESEEKRYDDATNSRFYFCLCFQTQEQMLEFTEKSKFNTISDSIFKDGMKAAKLMGIELTSEIPPVRKPKTKTGYEKYV